MSGYENKLQGQQRNADNFIDTNDVNIFPPNVKSETIELEEGPSIVITRDVSDSSIWGVGTWGTAYWRGTYLNAEDIVTVNSVNDLFIEHFNFDILLDTGSTTAEIDPDGFIHFDGALQQQLQSIHIYKDAARTITQALINVEGTNVDSTTILMKTSEGGDWQIVQLNDLTDLAVPGTELYYQINNNSGLGFPTPWATWGEDIIEESTIEKLTIRYY